MRNMVRKLKANGFEMVNTEKFGENLFFAEGFPIRTRINVMMCAAGQILRSHEILSPI